MTDMKRQHHEEMDQHAEMYALISKEELAELGDGEIAYIREMTSDEATEAFPAIEGLPDGINLFALHAADGRPIALTDDRETAIEHAMGDELEIATVH
ncbi:MAG: DUF1150 domain-containing protein [Pseudomonadota bacterium]